MTSCGSVVVTQAEGMSLDSGLSYDDQVQYVPPYVSIFHLLSSFPRVLSFLLLVLCY